MYKICDCFQVKRDIGPLRESVTDGLWEMTKSADVLKQDNWTTEVKEKLQKFETSLLNKMRKYGWDGSEGEEVTQWTFAGALFYSIIVITTIGELSFKAIFHFFKFLLRYFIKLIY